MSSVLIAIAAGFVVKRLRTCWEVSFAVFHVKGAVMVRIATLYQILADRGASVVKPFARVKLPKYRIHFFAAVRKVSLSLTRFVLHLFQRLTQPQQNL